MKRTVLTMLTKAKYSLSKFLLVIVLVVSNYSCINEDTSNCSQLESLLYIKITNTVTGESYESLDDIEDMVLFLFDPHERFINRIPIPSKQFREGEPIIISDQNLDGYWVALWGNLLENQLLSEITAECLLKDISISLITDDEGYCTCPDDLFFGWKQLDLSSGRQNGNIIILEDSIPVSRKNARMHITVKGLPEGEADSAYYFTIHTKNNGYSINGETLQKESVYKQSGLFGTNNDFATPESFNVIHTNPTDEGINICLYKASETKTPTLIASASTDAEGNYFIPGAGETANILIDLTQGDVIFSMQITPWNETFVWNKW